MGLVLLSAATWSVACGTGANQIGAALTHGNPIRLGQPFHNFSGPQLSLSLSA